MLLSIFEKHKMCLNGIKSLFIVNYKNTISKNIENFVMDVRFVIYLHPMFNPIQDWNGGTQKDRRTSFSPVTSTNVGISPKNFVTFTFNPFPTLV